MAPRHGATEEGRLVEELSEFCDSESATPSAPAAPRSWKRMMYALPLGLGALVGTAFLAQRSKPEQLAKSSLNGDITELNVHHHPAWINDCGGYDMEKLNDFSHGVETMMDAGWIFSGKNGRWSKDTEYRPDLTGILTPGKLPPSDKAFWGWDYPGNGMMRLRLHGSGEFKLDVGNAYSMGNVVVRLHTVENDILTISRIGPNDRHAMVKHHFQDGWMLTITEKNPRAIIVLHSIKFDCPTTGPAEPLIAEGQLRDQVGIDQFISGAKWNIVKMDDECSTKCVDTHVLNEAPSWGSATAISARTWCATQCLYADACEGFLYPDPGDGKNVCKLFSACQSDIQPRPANYNLNVKGKRGNIVQTYPATEYDVHPRNLEGEKNLCKEDLPKYAVHTIVDKTPPDYPTLVQEIN